MDLSIINWLLALLPILLIIVLMLVFRWGGSKSGALGLIVTLLIAFLKFGAGFELLGYAQSKAVLLSIDVLFIVWMALLLFHIANEAGAIKTIADALVSITRDRTLQGLLIGWIFVSFLQGMGGFGVPVAVTAPLLTGLGFSPIQSVVMASIGHGWAVNYGSMATSFQTLIAITGLPGELLAPDSALLLGLCCLICGIIVALVAGGIKGLMRNLHFVVLLSLVMGVAQYFLSVSGLWNLGATGAGIIGLIVGILLIKLPLTSKLFNGVTKDEDQNTAPEPISAQKFLVAVSAYGILVVLAFLINLIPVIKETMNALKLTLEFPQLETALGWITPAEAGRKIKVFGHTGAILFYASVLSYIIYRITGTIKPGMLKEIGKRVMNGAIKSSLGIISMVSLAIVMSHAGMTWLLAKGFASLGREIYPIASPFLGALGAFITGSNNNSNVLFAVLQMNTADLLDLPVGVILGAQTAGASIGSVFSPAKIIVGCSTVGLSNQEGSVMGKVIGYGLIPVVFIALATWIMV